jgi:hypothetical protein
MEPMVLFGIQFTLSLLAYALLAVWYVIPLLNRLPRPQALSLLLWIHVFRIVGGAILAPGSVSSSVPADFRTMIGYGDMLTAALAIIALIALRTRVPGAVLLVWLFLAIGTADTVNAIVQSVRDSVFNYPLGVNWVIVTMYVPALVVSSVLLVVYLIRPWTVAKS